VSAKNVTLVGGGHAKLACPRFAWSLDSDLKLCAEGSMIGIPYYVAPEVGRVRDLDGTSDLYSLGLVFYFLLTGKQPLEGRPAVEILSAKAHDKIPVPVVFAPIPDAVERVLAKMLEVDRSKRYPDAESLVRHLEALERGEDVSAPIAWWRKRPEDRAPPRPAPLVARPRPLLPFAPRPPHRAPSRSDLVAGIVLIIMCIAAVPGAVLATADMAAKARSDSLVVWFVGLGASLISGLMIRHVVRILRGQASNVIYRRPPAPTSARRVVLVSALLAVVGGCLGVALGVSGPKVAAEVALAQAVVVGLIVTISWAVTWVFNKLARVVRRR
jgi:hypothetical protein